MSFVMDLPSETLVDLLAHAVDKELEDKLWQKWLAELPNMDEKTFIPFEEYKRRTFTSKKKKSDDEIIQDAENILKSSRK